MGVFLRISLALAVVVLPLCGRGPLSRGPVSNYFSGNDPAKWRSRVNDIQGAPRDAAASAGTSSRLLWSTYIGDQNETQVVRIAVDAAGNTYVAGNRRFKTLNPQGSASETSDVLVAKLDRDGNLIYRTYLGGKGSEGASGIAPDAAGNVYVVGSTTSPNFPLRNAIAARPAGGFIAKLDPSGDLLFSTYFGVSYASSVNVVALDASGNAYVTGTTYSPDLPTTPGAYIPSGPGCGATEGPPPTSASFAGKIGPGGSLVYLTYLSSGSRCAWGSHCLSVAAYSYGSAIAVNAAGEAYIGGVSNGMGTFVAKVNPTGTALLYLKAVGSSSYGYPYADEQYDDLFAITIDSAGNAYVTGETCSRQFPVTPGAFQSAYADPPIVSPPGEAPPPDAFVTKISPDGSSFVYSTYLGAVGSDVGSAIAVDAQGNAYVLGASENLKLPPDSSLPQGQAFLVQLNATGSALLYTTRLPIGAGDDDLALDSSGRLHVAGSAGVVWALDLTANPGHGILALSNAAANRVYSLVAPGELVSIWGQGLGPVTPAGAVVENGAVTKSLSDTTVFFDEIPAPLLYVSQGQINAAVPYGIAGWLMTTVRVVYKGATTGTFLLGVASWVPELFKNADGSAAAANEDGSLNSPSNPAKAGSIVVLFGTGGGLLDPPAEDGSVENPATPIYALQLYPGTILFCGAAPTLVSGVFQINLRLPAGPYGTTTMPLHLYAGTYFSEPAVVYVTQ